MTWAHAGGATQPLRPNYEHRAPCPRPGRLPRAASPQVGRTPGISCEAVPASKVDRRGHEAALLPRNGAAESFVSFIPLFGSTPATPASGHRQLFRPSSVARLRLQIDRVLEGRP